MSALTSLLVRDDIVSVRQIEDALQRQVLDGVELDTALLEVDALPENVLIAYRAASERAQPASREEVMGASSATRVLMSPELAKAFRVTPVSHDATGLTVATASPLTAAQVSELVAQTGLRIEWRITSELRVYAALERFYGRPLPPRMAALIMRVDTMSAGELLPVEPLQVTPRVGLSSELLEGFDESEDFETALEAAFDRVSGSPPPNAPPPIDSGATRPLGELHAAAPARRAPASPRSKMSGRPGRVQETARLGSSYTPQPLPLGQRKRPDSAGLREQPSRVADEAGLVMDRSALPLPAGRELSGRERSLPVRERTLAGHDRDAPQLAERAAAFAERPHAFKAPARERTIPGHDHEQLARDRDGGLAGRERTTPGHDHEQLARDRDGGLAARERAIPGHDHEQLARDRDGGLAGRERGALLHDPDALTGPARDRSQGAAHAMPAQDRGVGLSARERGTHARESNAPPRARGAQASETLPEQGEAFAPRPPPLAASSRRDAPSTATDADALAANRAPRGERGNTGGMSRKPGLRLPPGPLSAAMAEEALASADERDTVVEIFFRFARQYFDTTVLLSIKDERALGAQAHNASALVDVRHISVPILRGAAIDDMVRSLLPRVVDMSRKDEDRQLVLSLKRLQDQPAALIPVCIKRRVVSFVYGDRAGERFALDELSELLGLLPHVSRAFERIIHTRKALGLSTGRTPARRREREFQHAPTQLSIELPALPPVLPDDSSSVADPRTREALEALGVPRPAPTPPPPVQSSARELPRPDELPEIDPDSFATARMSIEPLSLDEPELKPLTHYLSKPPPGTGRYKSLAPGPAERSRSEPPPPAAAPRKARAADAPAEDTQPVRRRSSVPSKKSNPRASLPPPAPSPVPIHSAAGRASLHASKPAPGTGSYHRQGVTTELISMPPGPMPELPQPEKRRESARPPAEPHSALLQHAPQLMASAAEPAVVSTPDEAPSAPLAAPPPPVTPPEPPPVAAKDSSAAEARTQAEQLLIELCTRKIDEELHGVQALHALGAPALDLLLERFPGPLWFDRRKPHARVPFGRDIGPLCRALEAFGGQALARFAPLLRANATETRYYATLFACDRVHAALLEPLLERLFDEDPQIRLLVRDVLPHYRKLPGFTRVAERLCAEATSSQAQLHARLAAIDAIGVLRDSASVPTLIELVANGDKQISVPAHRALTSITCQDFAKSAKKWRAWYEDNAYRHRVEWLIDGLMHADQALRASAGLELQKLTQVYYGYVAGASKRDRELAQKRYWDWWRGEGRKKF